MLVNIIFLIKMIKGWLAGRLKWGLMNMRILLTPVIFYKKSDKFTFI